MEARTNERKILQVNHICLKKQYALCRVGERLLCVGAARVAGGLRCYQARGAG